MSHTHKLSWAAGFFDGEGYITISKRGRKYPGLYLTIGLNHVNVRPLLQMVQLFGGALLKQPGKNNRHDRYQWRIQTRKAEAAITQMLPYFNNKDIVARLALGFQKTLNDNGERVDENTQWIREMFKVEIQRLNSLD